MMEQLAYGRTEEDILRYLPLVKKVVDRIGTNNKQNMEREDLIHIGIIGLMDAFSRYDASKNTPFEHYAKWRIRGTILDELRKNGLISRDRMSKVNRLYEAVKILQQRQMREPTDKEICEYLGIDVHQLDAIHHTVHFLSQYSLEGTLFVADQKDYSLKDILVDENAENPIETLEADERSLLLAEAIEGLKERERFILNLYYYEELPLKDIAVLLGVSLSRVSQIHGKILLKMRGYLSEEGGTIRI
ncbi:MAG: FliA/WhiG family RNA polymerase sigma factor [Peptostreptococcaceae bacterium]|nr:FliA/WhiG family RNA polymerase sigma factor [Peptostreptococcaceae bacterium]